MSEKKLEKRLRVFIKECRKMFPDDGCGSRYYEGYNDASNDVADQLENMLRDIAGWSAEKTESE